MVFGTESSPWWMKTSTERFRRLARCGSLSVSGRAWRRPAVSFCGWRPASWAASSGTIRICVVTSIVHLCWFPVKEKRAKHQVVTAMLLGGRSKLVVRASTRGLQVQTPWWGCQQVARSKPLFALAADIPWTFSVCCKQKRCM